jgi:hypothetical protein
MRSRKWKGAKAKFHHQQNSSTSKIWQLVEHQGAASKSLSPMQFGAKTQNFKSVKMITNYGG